MCTQIERAIFLYFSSARTVLNFIGSLNRPVRLRELSLGKGALVMSGITPFYNFYHLVII